MTDATLNITGKRTNCGNIAATATLTVDKVLTIHVPENVADAAPFVVSLTAAEVFNLNVSDGTNIIQTITVDRTLSFYPTATGYVIARMR